MMNTRILMSTSAFFLGLTGVVFSFLPHELLAFLGTAATGITPYLLQLAGAAFLGFAMLNWMAKAILIGGIYAKPVALGNFLHFTAGALSLLKAASANEIPALWLIALPYSVFALCFGYVLFRHPVKVMKG